MQLIILLKCTEMKYQVEIEKKNQAFTEVNNVNANIREL